MTKSSEGALYSHQNSRWMSATAGMLSFQKRLSGHETVSTKAAHLMIIRYRCLSVIFSHPSFEFREWNASGCSSRSLENSVKYPSNKTVSSMHEKKDCDIHSHCTYRRSKSIEPYSLPLQLYHFYRWESILWSPLQYVPSSIWTISFC